jgi:hypothetical protein
MNTVRAKLCYQYAVVTYARKKISFTNFIVTHVCVFKAQKSLQYIVLLSIYRVCHCYCQF